MRTTTTEKEKFIWILGSSIEQKPDAFRGTLEQCKLFAKAFPYAGDVIEMYQLNDNGEPDYMIGCLDIVFI